MLSAFMLVVAMTSQDPGPPLHPLIDLDRRLPAIIDEGRPMAEAPAFVEANGRDAMSVEITAKEDMSRTSLSVVFYWSWLADPGPERRPIWFARLRAMDWDGSIERLADSRTCPGVEETLRLIDALPPIQPRAPGLPDPDATTIEFGGYLHDNTYAVRTRGAYTAAYTQRLEITGGSDTPLAPLVDEALTRLQPCWTDVPPSGP
ncbi:MAG: hypothetical protein KKC29_03815 [Alphaproteobacteria bacterium]|jgi:hypothetical protein|nr:hypothetical protein [Alphaproteobacteria bacterium]MBU2043134.1 hypothetical protein [Alphaproteobacteria bacterium]MBU2124464.1 hypothetical protein [Alphaproteobacteria bacterium]MBU2207686.1 hypothetical protein [Alphaproteobacteria bacterium]MBU2290209.1 hypothetical protein [Alphaproteobacteria bacterium]